MFVCACRAGPAEHAYHNRAQSNACRYDSTFTNLSSEAPKAVLGDVKLDLPPRDHEQADTVLIFEKSWIDALEFGIARAE